MKLSIITINYNNKAGLQKTLDSVLAQTCKDFEWIVIDGGSTDGSKELIEQHQDAIAYWCSESDKGVFNAMNKGVEKACGEYCMFLNSGDRFHAADVVEIVQPYLADIDFVMGNECVVDSCYNIVRTRNNPELFDPYYLLVGSLWHQSMFIKTYILKERPYDESFKIVGDWDMTFYQLVLNKRTYKHIDVVISDFILGGISTDLASAGAESRKRIDEYLSRREQDDITLSFLSRRKDPSSLRQISELAYTAFANSYYSQQEYLEVFAPYRKILISNSTVYHRFFNFICLSGLMHTARVIYRCYLFLSSV